MWVTRLGVPVASFALLASLVLGPVRGAAAQAVTLPGESQGLAPEDEGLAPPPGDPWYARQQQPQRGGRAGLGEGLVFKARLTPHWFEHGTHFWYRNDLPAGAREFIVVDAEKGTRAPAFDHERLAMALSTAAGGEAFKADRLPFDTITFTDGLKGVRFRVGDVTWLCKLDSYECSKSDGEAPAREEGAAGAAQGAPQRFRGRPGGGDDQNGDGPREGLRSPDGKWTAFVKDHDVYIRGDGESDSIRLSHDGKEGLSYGRLAWAPDSTTLVAFRIEPGDRKEVYLIQSSPPSGGRAKFQARPYPLPGDKFTAYELNLFDIATKQSTRPEVDRIDFGMPRLRWDDDGTHFTYQKTDRGHQRFRLVEVDAHTGKARNLIDEKSDTFIWSAHTENVGLSAVTWLEKSDEIIYASERDGWRHLYLVDARQGEVRNQITKGEYVVRGVERIDEAARQIWFRASGRNADQDPYFVHYYRVNFDGTGLVPLTEGDGSHSVQFSPDGKYLVDTYSRVDLPPVHELRRAEDGKLVCKLEEADISALKATGWEPPEVFVARGRDGKTDIWGIICRPRTFDPHKKYPVIEQIYAGPQGSFVPKTFSPIRRFASLTDLGFIVVQMDGMGTANRSKAFHDVCWHNLKDAGFADRILWHQAAAQKYAYYDLSRVGIYGTSAGGQNSTAGVLFHPEFYKVAVSACGCHDNRMDKASWNEQWMGYPVGPWYAESSNIDNAHRLRGKLLLIVGEMDTNVPPESTMRLVDALIKAGKDFELLVVPNAGHGMGGAYGQRRMHDFFVRHLLASEPPDRNAEPAPRRDDAVARAAGKAEHSGESNHVESLDLADLNSDRSELRGVIERYRVDHGSFQRSLPPAASPERDARLREFDTAWLKQLGKLDFDGLSRDGQVDYLLFKNYLDHEIRQIDLRSSERAQAAPLVPFAQPILDLDAARRELKPMDWSQVAGTLTALTKTITDARRELERKPHGEARVPRPVANRALSTLESLRTALRTWFGFYDGYDPMFSWWIREPYKGADQALQAYATTLRERLGATPAGGDDDGRPGMFRRRPPAGREGPQGPGSETAATAARNDGRDIVGNPIGREALLSELAYEMVPYTPEQLLELANREFAWCEAEMKKAAHEMGLGDDWRAALERVKTHYVEPGKQPELIRKLAVEAIDYLDANNLVTIPPLCRDSWRIAMMSPERQLVNPFFTGGEVISVSYPTDAMAHEAKMMSMRGNNIHFARATVFHELIPGHHLQGYMLSRYRTYRAPFGTAFWTEGWPLYWELLLWDRGFTRTPEDRVGALFWRMHRCARIIFSLSFHLEKMTPKECIDFLVERVGHERDNATAEVRRSFAGDYGPLYQAAYLLGGLQLRALHRELVESGKMTDLEFHDTLLKQNHIPIEMMRAALTKEPLSRDYVPNWKFYGPIEVKE